jgi:proteic killer suppression protein
VIRTFRDDETKTVFATGKSRKLPQSILAAAVRKMIRLNDADYITDLLSPPGDRLEKLTGDRAGQWCIRINDQYRICFEWIEPDAYNVEIVDYH